ncbi:hypothetical protein V8C42DRAFT_308194 [Trichoderma barbatum]
MDDRFFSLFAFCGDMAWAVMPLGTWLVAPLYEYPCTCQRLLGPLVMPLVSTKHCTLSTGWWCFLLHNLNRHHPKSCH